MFVLVLQLKFFWLQICLQSCIRQETCNDFATHCTENARLRDRKLESFTSLKANNCHKNKFQRTNFGSTTHSSTPSPPRDTVLTQFHYHTTYFPRSPFNVISPSSFSFPSGRFKSGYQNSVCILCLFHQSWVSSPSWPLLPWHYRGRWAVVS